MKVNQGSENITPNFAYDDGVFTYLGFDNTKIFPAVFAYELGKESILNTHIKKDGNYDVLVIHQTLPKILLRSGDKVVGIFNRGYTKNPLKEKSLHQALQVILNLIRTYSYQKALIFDGAEAFSQASASYKEDQIDKARPILSCILVGKERGANASSYKA